MYVDVIQKKVSLYSVILFSYAFYCFWKSFCNKFDASLTIIFWPIFVERRKFKDRNKKTIYIQTKNIYSIYIYIDIYIFKTYIYSNKTFESSMKLYKNQNIIITILSNDLKLLNTSQNLHCMTYDYFFKLRCFF